jgi:hypothetical protein
MKYLLLVVFLIICGAATSRGQEYGTGPQRFFDEYYAFVVPAEMVESAPKWKESEALPPLLPRDAALSAVQRLASTFALIPRWKVEAITLKRVFPDNWIYLVEASDRSTAIAGIPWRLVVPVLMDGKTVAPILVKPEDLK